MSASTDLWETWRSNPQVHPIETMSDSTVEFDKNTVRFDWGMSCFPELANVDREAFNQNLIDEILAEEQNIAHDNGVVGRSNLKVQPVNKEFKSTKYGKKMFSMSSNIDLRTRYIAFFKAASKHAYDAYQAIKQGAYNILFPPGMIMPGGKLLQELSKNQLYDNLGVCYG